MDDAYPAGYAAHGFAGLRFEWSDYSGRRFMRDAGTYDIATRRLVVPYGYAAAGAVVAPAVWLSARARRRKRVAAGLCPACGYDLRATPGRCPECGKVPTGPSRPV